MAESTQETSTVEQDTQGSDEHGGSGHVDPFSFVLFELLIIVAVAMTGRWMAQKLNLPSVLGELTLGVVLGNIGFWVGLPMAIVIMNMGDISPLLDEVWKGNQTLSQAAATVYSQDQMLPGGIGEQMLRILTGPDASRYFLMALALWMFSNLGIILLLFMVGLESRVDEMLRVGPRSLAVAIIGVVVPFALGYGASYWLLPQDGQSVHLFLGATLCATSVGITARVFKDLGKLQTPEAKVILGAAVIDDILGLMILAVVSGIVVTGSIQVAEIARISILSVVFIGAVIIFGDRFVRLIIPYVFRLDRLHSKLLFPLSLAFALSWLANQIELATIVGAFAAGLILNEEHFDRHADPSKTIEQLIEPLEAIFAPIFFVLMGMQVNLASFANPATLWLAFAFTVAAVLGKVVSGIPVGSRLDRLSVGFGMIPRGEVGLIFASIGKSLGVVTDSVFSAVVMMVIVTTLVTPILLRWSLFRKPAAA